jgi:SAM-dependent methyltransferase
MHEYHQVMTNLRQSYNQQQAEQRDLREPEPWKHALRQQFLSLLQQEGKTKLLEIGAGTGQDSLFFHNNGLSVVCTDLSAEMVQCCRAKGLVAYVMDFLSLDFPAHSFDAVYALNCLHHVPSRDLPAVQHTLWHLLRPGGLFSLCVYGGMEWEGVREQDWHQPPRFFAYHTDERLRHITAPLFDLVSFHTLPSEMKPLSLQCLIL